MEQPMARPLPPGPAQVRRPPLPARSYLFGYLFSLDFHRKVFTEKVPAPTFGVWLKALMILISALSFTRLVVTCYPSFQLFFETSPAQMANNIGGSWPAKFSLTFNSDPKHPPISQEPVMPFAIHLPAWMKHEINRYTDPYLWDRALLESIPGILPKTEEESEKEKGSRRKVEVGVVFEQRPLRPPMSGEDLDLYCIFRNSLLIVWPDTGFVACYVLMDTKRANALKKRIDPRKLIPQSPTDEDRERYSKWWKEVQKDVSEASWAERFVTTFMMDSGPLVSSFVDENHSPGSTSTYMKINHAEKKIILNRNKVHNIARELLAGTFRLPIFQFIIVSYFKTICSLLLACWEIFFVGVVVIQTLLCVAMYFSFLSMALTLFAGFTRGVLKSDWWVPSPSQIRHVCGGASLPTIAIISLVYSFHFSFLFNAIAITLIFRFTVEMNHQLAEQRPAREAAEEKAERKRKRRERRLEREILDDLMPIPPMPPFPPMGAFQPPATPHWMTTPIGIRLINCGFPVEQYSRLYPASIIPAAAPATSFPPAPPSPVAPEGPAAAVTYETDRCGSMEVDPEPLATLSDASSEYRGEEGPLYPLTNRGRASRREAEAPTSEAGTGSEPAEVDSGPGSQEPASPEAPPPEEKASPSDEARELRQRFLARLEQKKTPEPES